MYLKSIKLETPRKWEQIMKQKHFAVCFKKKTNNNNNNNKTGPQLQWWEMNHFMTMTRDISRIFLRRGAPLRNGVTD